MIQREENNSIPVLNLYSWSVAISFYREVRKGDNRVGDSGPLSTAPLDDYPLPFNNNDRYINVYGAVENSLTFVI